MEFTYTKKYLNCYSVFEDYFESVEIIAPTFQIDSRYQFFWITSVYDSVIQNTKFSLGNYTGAKN